MPRNTRLLGAALTLVTLSLSPRDSFAGPLQEAAHKVPPDWLTRSGGPRQTRLGMSCGKKLLLGLGIGAGAGLGYTAFMAARADGGLTKEAVLSVPVLFGGVGTLVGYRLCR